MSNKKLDRNLHRLINAAVSGALTDEDQRRLDEALSSNDEALAAYLNYCQLEVELFFRCRAQLTGQRILSQIDLHDLGSCPDIAASPQTEQSRRYRLNPQRLMIFAAATAILVATACTLSWVGGWRHGRESLKSSLAIAPPANVTPAAYVTSVNGCTWDEGPTPAVHQIGSAIQAGNELNLYEGIASFQLSSGVSLSIEGPASLVITSPTSLMLQYGKLTANIPARVQDFRVLAGACHVAAHDAELGVIVTASKLEVHAFKGEARLSLSPFPGILQGAAATADYDDIDSQAELLILVKQGQATALRPSGEVQRSMPANRNQFAAKLSMNGRLPVTTDYVNAVLESRPVSYWRFESIEGGTVRNEVAGAQPLTVVDNVRLAGDARNYSLELNDTKSGGHLVSDLPVPLSGSDYSVEIWCKPSHFHRGTLVAMGFEDERKQFTEILHHAFILQTQRSDDRYAQTLINSVPGSIRFLHRNPPTRDPRTGTSCYSNRLYEPRRWQHVVAVKEKDSMRLYINGTLAASAKDATDIVPDLRLMIGNAFFRRPELQPSRPFLGQLDELAIYDRALSEEEILKHHQSINFRTPKAPTTKHSLDRSVESASSAQNHLGANTFPYLIAGHDGRSIDR